MMNAPRHALLSERSQVRELISATYHDSEAFSDLFFTECFRTEDTYVIADDSGLVLATGMMLPCRFKWRGETYPVGFNYAAAVREGYHRMGLMKEITKLANSELALSGASHALTYINLKANKPWQSIGYSPAFPMRVDRFFPEPLDCVGISVIDERSPKLLARLDSLYETAFEDYAHWARSAADWDIILREYAIDGFALLMERGGAPVGYCVCEVSDDGLIIRECVGASEHDKKALQTFAVRRANAEYAECWQPSTASDPRSVPTGIVMRLAPGGMPDFPYDKGYLNLYFI